ncbi:MAG: HipA domain-containing protein [Burkholderiaceae bacterium]|nr:HipA domain-containing protein [Burkholderiaceae bacterium]
MRSLHVFSNGRPVGVLSDENNLWRFQYDAQWVADPAAFDLSPHLKKSDTAIIDGATQRPVQWFFDNLLPEEEMRTALSKEAKLPYEDAFGLLEYLGMESAGFLILRPPGVDPAPMPGTQELSDAALSARIRKLPTATLGSRAPKRMSMAGAQHKLLVIYVDGKFHEPVGATPSTHLLKPDHPGKDEYPSSVINEYAMMKLADALGLTVPQVFRHYCPEPVYIVARFDRVTHGELPAHAPGTERLQMIDTCQLLNKARSFKYTSANLQTLNQVIDSVRSKGPTRLALYRWLVFNLLIGNNDNHIKNISFFINQDGLTLAPFYDLLSTATYLTQAFAKGKAIWPHVDLAFPLPGQPRFADVTRDGVVQAGVALGLTPRICTRELDHMLAHIGQQLDRILDDIAQENARLPLECHPYLGGEMSLLRAIRHIVVGEMVVRLSR